MTRYEDCIGKGLLRRIPASDEKAIESLKAANNWLSESDKNLKHKTFNSSIIASYLAMFHASRSILFRDGYREKSHYCIARYLEEKYVKSGKLESKWVELLDYYREIRHDDQYSPNFLTNEDEASKCLATAKEFVSRIEKLLSNLT